MSGTGINRRGIEGQVSMRKTWGQRLASVWFGMILNVVIPSLMLGADATLLPNAKQQYLDDSGNPVASGSVGYYVPSTSTKKTVWQDAAKATPQTNPVLLDAAGRPQPAGQTYGDGVYRQVVRDVNNIVIWDAVTTSTGSGGGGGTPSSEGVMVGTILPWVNTSLPSKYLYTAGQAISRTTYSQLMTAITFSTTILCQSGFSLITVSTTISDMTPIGAPVEAPCFPTGTVVTNKSSGQLTVNSIATVTTSTVAVIFPTGNGNGSTTFNVPDTRGLVLAGRDNMGGTAAGRLTTAIYGSNPDAINAVGGSQTTTLLLSNLPPYTPTGVNGPTTSSGLFLQGGVPDNFSSVAGSGQFDNLTKANVTAPAATFTGIAQGGASAPFSRVQPTLTADFIIKALPDDSPSGPGVSSLGGMTGAIACGSGIVCNAQTVSLGSFANGLPVIGQGTGNPLTTGTKTGTTTVFATGSGVYVDGNCLKSVSGNVVDDGKPCDIGASNVSYRDIFCATPGRTNCTTSDPGVVAYFTPGITTSLTLPHTPVSAESTSVLVDGVDWLGWTLSGSTINFSIAIPAKAETVAVRSLTTIVLPTWVTYVNGQTGNVVATPVNLIRNSGLSVSTAVGGVFVGDPISISTFGNYATPVGMAFFNTSAGTGGLVPGALAAIQGPSPHASQTLTGINVTLGTTLSNAPVGSFTGVTAGDIVWMKGGTYTYNGQVGNQTQCRVTSVAGDGSSLAIACPTALTTEGGKTFILAYIQRSSVLDSSVNGMPDTGNCCTGNPGLLAYPIRVLDNTASGSGVAFFGKLSGWAGNAPSGGPAIAYQWTAGDFGGSGQGPDYFSKSPTLQYFKMKNYDWDGITPVVMPGEAYSAKLIKGSAGAEYFFNALDRNNPNGAPTPIETARYWGKTITCAAYIKNSTANSLRAFIFDGVSFTYSPYVAAGGFQWVELQKTISTVADRVWAGSVSDGPSSAIGDTQIYTQPICIYGTGIGTGNYRRTPPALKAFTGHINPFYYINRDVPVAVRTFIEQETAGTLPEGLHMILSDMEANHPGNVTSGLILTDSFNAPTSSALTLYQQPINSTLVFTNGTTTLAANTGAFLGLGYQGTIAQTSFPVAYSATLTGIAASVALNSGGTSAYQAYINGVGQTLACSITSGTSCSSTTDANKVNLSPGDVVGIKATSSTAVTTHNVSLMITGNPAAHVVSNAPVAVGQQAYVVGANTYYVDQQVIFPADTNWQALNIDYLGAVY